MILRTGITFAVFAPLAAARRFSTSMKNGRRPWRPLPANEPCRAGSRRRTLSTLTPFTLIRRPPPESQVSGFQGISPFLGYGPERECAAQRKTYRYFRDYGVHVTSEHSAGGRLDPFVGLQPMAWIYKSSKETARVERPAGDVHNLRLGERFWRFKAGHAKIHHLSPDTLLPRPGQR
jgi:hypothetical protein